MIIYKIIKNFFGIYLRISRNKKELTNTKYKSINLISNTANYILNFFNAERNPN